MTLAIGWWIAAGLAAAAELLTGTFVLLMLAVGLGLAGTLAGFGAPLPAQLVAVAFGMALAGWAALRHWRRRPGSTPEAQSDPRMHLDIGQTVHVDAWQDDGTTQVHYRGTLWQGRLAEGSRPRAASYRIQSLDGSRLVLAEA